MDIGAWVLVFYLLILVIGGPAAFLIVRKLTEEIKVSDTVVINRDTGRAGGMAFGNLVSKETGKNGRLVIKYLSRDSKKPKVVKQITEANKVITYSKGLWSGERNIIEILPDSAQDYFNNLLTDIETKSAESNIIKAQREGLNRQATHLTEIGEGEVSDLLMGLGNDFREKLLKSQFKETTRRGPGSYPSAEEFKA